MRNNYVKHLLLICLLPVFLISCDQPESQVETEIPKRTQKPPLHAKKWMAITGKPLAATSGAHIFHQGGNAIDAACAMLATTCTMWDALSWGGETQALIYHPKTGKVLGINALGVAPSGATPEFFKEKDMNYPPEYGPLAAVTPGTPGGLITMLAEYGTMSLAQVLAPAIDMAGGYPIEAQAANIMEKQKDRIKEYPYSKKIYLTHLGEEDREAPYPGEMFVQADLKLTLEKMVEAESKALQAGKSRKEAIYAAYDRFYKGDIAEELVRGTQEQGGLITMEDLANWKVYIEEPVMTTYKDIEVYKLTTWVQGPVLLQALNMMEQLDVANMKFNSAEYIHSLYQVMNLAFADRDFYYGDPYFDPVEPIQGLLSKEYAKERVSQINWSKNIETLTPGNPYRFEGKENPYTDYLANYHDDQKIGEPIAFHEAEEFPSDVPFYYGTTSIQTADEDGWVVSITPSGGWIAAVVAGNTGVGLSQRMQSFVLDEKENPFNVVEPGKRPRATLTPSMALKDGKPYISFAVQGGDTQDQNSLQFFLNMVEFGMTVQQACEGPNIHNFQMKGSFGEHTTRPGVMIINDITPEATRKALEKMGYKLNANERTSGPLNAIYFDREHGTMWGGSSNHGEDYGIGW